MIFGKLLKNDDRINEVNEIFKEVFVDELNYKGDDLFEITDKQVIHALIYDDLDEKNAVAAGRMIIDKENAWIKWIAVRKNYRNREYGDMIIRMLTDKAFKMSVKNIFAEVPANLADMFGKIGFKSYYDEKDNIIKENYIIMKYGYDYLKCCNNK